MFTEEWNIEEAKKAAAEEAKVEGTINNIRKMMKNLKLTAEAAMEILEIPKADFSKYMAML